ncbi:MAG: hypothetical protein AB7H77_04725 [Bdellovibrionales bacterium]
MPPIDQALHSIHFLLCAFAVLVACIPLLTPKGSLEHKFGGKLYLPFSFAALSLASYMAWHEASLLLFCFDAFCLYLLLSGWRAIHEKETPRLIDWLIPAGLFALAGAVTFMAMFQNNEKTTLYLFLFAFNAFYLSLRDLAILQKRAHWLKNQVFFAGRRFGLPQTTEWLNRHIAGMAGSFMANLSVVALTLLPLSLHWLWPVTLVTLAGGIAYSQHRRKARVRKTVAAIIHPAFHASARKRMDENLRRAA